MRLSHCPCLLHSSFISKIEGDVKEPTLLFEKSRGSFLGDVVHLAYIIHIAGWVGYSELINGLIAAARLKRPCMLTSELNVNMWTSCCQEDKSVGFLSTRFHLFTRLLGHGRFSPVCRPFFLSGRVYEVWLVSYFYFTFQIWYFRKWIIASIEQSNHMRVTRFNLLWVSGNTWYKCDWMIIQAFKNMSTQLSVNSVPFIFTGS